MYFGLKDLNKTISTVVLFSTSLGVGVGTGISSGKVGTAAKYGAGTFAIGFGLLQLYYNYGIEEEKIVPKTYRIRSRL